MMPAAEGSLSCTVRNGTEVLGFVAIDSMVDGRARGGLRLKPDVSGEEVRELARAMTLKYGFLGLPQGGAKAGVLGEPEAPEFERRQRLADFARRIAPLLQSGLYLPDADMGTTNADIRFMLEIAGVRPKRREWRGTRSGAYTALTVLEGVRRAGHRLGIDLAEARAAVEGLGAVGGEVARLLHAAGARVVAVSTSRGAVYDSAGLDVPELLERARREGSRAVDGYPRAERLETSKLAELPVDFLCPCAAGHSLHAGNAGRIAARAISAGANCMATAEVERTLHARGILCLPDFITNCGGVLGGTMEFAGVGPAGIADFVRRRVGPRIGQLLEEAERRGVTPRDVAEPKALERNARRRDGSYRSRIGLAPLLELHRRGWIPPRLAGALAPAYFARALGGPC